MFFMKKSHGLFVIVLLIRTLKFSYCKFQGKIVGASETTIIEYPHAVFLDASCGGIEWICGSSVLNQKILLTASMCVFDCDFKNNDTIDTIGGNEDIRKKAVTRKVIEKRIHKKFNELLIKNDIALLKVDRDFPLNNNIKRVIIPISQYPRPKSGAVTGWGAISEEKAAEDSNILKVVKQTVRNKQTCKIIGRLHPGMFCAGSTVPEDSHPTYGDTGNAFITSSYKQIGVASFSVKDAPALMVYTNVTYYYNWIVKYSKDIFCTED